MNVVKFSDDAKRLNVSVEAVRVTYEKALSEGKIHGVIVPEKAEIIRFKPDEIGALAIKVGAESVSLNTLAEELNLTANQVCLILDYMLKENRISGVLTNDDKFVPDATLREALITTARKNKNINVSESTGTSNDESINSVEKTSNQEKKTPEDPITKRISFLASEREQMCAELDQIVKRAKSARTSGMLHALTGDAQTTILQMQQMNTRVHDIQGEIRKLDFEIEQLQSEKANKGTQNMQTDVEEKMFCRYCGVQNETDAVFCKKCGKKIA